MYSYDRSSNHVQDVYLDTNKYLSREHSAFEQPLEYKTDKRVQAILEAAEKEFYKEKQRQYEAESYIRRKN